jgi:uncharacterized protein YbjT (DUF2867 family)
MRVVLFGASGMIGQGVLRECLLDPGVESVLVIGRSPTGRQHPKLREIVHHDFLDFAALEPDLTGIDACFYCLGVSSFRMTEADYSRITYDYTLAAAQLLARLNPGLVVVYISGAGTDSSSRTMWKRVKGATEDALLSLHIRGAYMFRPGFIVPLHGIRSKTRLYRFFYWITAPLLPVIGSLFPRQVTTTEKLGRAMIRAARDSAPVRILESADIDRLSR